MSKLLLTFGVFMTLLTHAQTIGGTIYGKDNQKPIPYAKIGIDNEGIGVQADENGAYKIKLDNVNPDKELMILVGGYQIYKSKVSDFVKENPRNIYLEPKVFDIQEVAINPTYKEKNLGVNTKSKSMMYTPNMEKGRAVVEETAVEFSSSKKVKLTKINMNFARFESTQPITVRYTIYDEVDNRPGNLILQKEIITTISKDQVVDQTFGFDVSKDNIWLQGKFYVGIQFIGKADGKIALSGALLRAGYFRSFYGPWEKIPVAAPAINIDVKYKK